MIAFSMDVDWAADPIIEFCLDLFRKYNVKCTLFATHYSDLLLKAEKEELFEIGIHPNFNPLLRGNGGSADKVVEDILEIYPNAKGVRSHSLTQSGLILDIFKSKGLVYESCHFLPYYEKIKPFVLWNDLVRIPFNWEDDYHFALGKNFETSGVSMSENNLTVFSFHPVFVFLNTESYNSYYDFRTIIHKYEELFPFRNNSNQKGVRDILIETLNEVTQRKLLTYKLFDIAKTVTWR
jgi:hypothetical protein